MHAATSCCTRRSLPCAAQNGILSLKSTLLSDQLTLAQIANGYTHDIHGIDPASACTSKYKCGCVWVREHATLQ
ncbi:hypothetical protein EON66_00890 [archaeon]|nr:MAG: hypothetical protein EON66_00890 [archaeon]